MIGLCKKNLNACNTDYLITRAEKGENLVFNFSTAMHELYRAKLAEHFQNLNNDPDIKTRVTFKDAAEKSSLLVESTIKKLLGTKGGRSKYTINSYHTNNSMMVNGRMAVQFNDEHAKITESIMASDQVSQLDQDICAKIVEGLGDISVCKPQKRTRPAVPTGVDTSMSVPASSNDSSYRLSSADTLRSGKNTKGLCAQDGNMPLLHSGEGD